MASVQLKAQKTKSKNRTLSGMARLSTQANQERQIMNEIKIPESILDNAITFSSSRAESGLENIGEITWRNAVEYAKENLLCPDKDELVDYFREFGAWSKEELQATSLVEINALLVQFIAGEVRRLEECETDAEIDWSAVEQAANEGQVSGIVYPDEQGNVCFVMSH